jgi:hypothetical protein
MKNNSVSARTLNERVYLKQTAYKIYMDCQAVMAGQCNTEISILEDKFGEIAEKLNTNTESLWEKCEFIQEQNINV